MLMFMTLIIVLYIGYGTAKWKFLLISMWFCVFIRILVIILYIFAIRLYIHNILVQANTTVFARKNG